MAVFWMLADGSATPFDGRTVELDTTDAMFGPEFREMLERGGDSPS